MNLLFLIGKYPSYGGTEVVTTVLANAFSYGKKNVAIASFEQPLPELKKELRPGIQLYSLSYPVYSGKNIKLLRTIIKKNKIDIIINQWCLPFHVTRLINKAGSGCDFRLISVLHGEPHKNKRLLNVEYKLKTTNNFINAFYYKLLYLFYLKATSINIRYVYKNSDNYVLLSNSFTDSFKKITGFSKAEVNKLIVIGNPITIDNNNFEYDPKKKEKIILYVGRMDHINKRVHRVVEAWENLFKIYPDWKLVLVGDGPEKQTLKKYAELKNIKNIHFKAFSKDPPVQYYSRASILMLTSNLEGFGLVIVEGMSFGVVPIVYGSYQAVYDIIENNKSGFITTPPYDKYQTITCLRQLMDNKNKLESFAKHSIQCSKKYNLGKILNKWYNLFDKRLMDLL